MPAKDDFIFNKYTGRMVKRGNRAHAAYVKRLKREEEDKALLVRSGAAPHPPPQPQQTERPTRKQALKQLHTIIDSIGEDDDLASLDHKLDQMFQELGFK
jgi:hypothetical protein